MPEQSSRSDAADLAQFGYEESPERRTGKFASFAVAFAFRVDRVRDIMTSEGVSDVVVIGAAIARALAGTHLSVTLVEARNDIGDGTSKAKTGLLHTVATPPPGHWNPTWWPGAVSCSRVRRADEHPGGTHRRDAGGLDRRVPPLSEAASHAGWPAAGKQARPVAGRTGSGLPGAVVAGGRCRPEGRSARRELAAWTAISGGNQTGSSASITAASCLAERHSCMVITSW